MNCPRLLILCFFNLLCFISFSQDVGVTNILTQNSGCDLQYPQTVTIEVTNFSPVDLNVPLTLTYKLNSLAVVTQNATLAIGSGSSTTFTFAVPISSGLNHGQNTIVASATNVLDGNTSNDAFTKNFNNDLASIGGDAQMDSSFCDTINNGSVQVVGFQGKILMWQKSINNGASWSNIADTNNFILYNNLTKTTLFRSIIKSGSCSSVSSQAATIEINEKPTLPIVTQNGPVCIGTVLNLTANSIDRSNYFWSGPNGYSSTQQNPNRLVTDTSFAGVYSVYAAIGECVGDTITMQVRVVSGSEGGMTSGATLVCQEENKGTVDLQGYEGSVVQWEYSENNGADWVVLGGTEPFKNYENIRTDRDYRALIKNGTCPSAYSTQSKIRVTYEGCQSMIIANLLTPNGDGKNDTWLIQRIDESVELSVKIFSRTGKEVYSSNNYANDWDGSSKGEKLQDGTYYYFIRINGSEKVLKGSVNLMR
ncbi:MAG: gliding motility-associated C-terminal domain-containing protein [Bacteroidetes bacterium]|nr:gliding motility-associated C-terminal domain-containing protein [Bacteroidota bacterium]